MRFAIAAVTMMVFGGIAAAQHQHSPSPYTGLQQRTIKALSEQQISDLRAGRGMGLALAAELNGYPGPLHVLELADQIELSGEQRQRVQQLYDTMKAEAVPVGEMLIAHESALDRAFAMVQVPHIANDDGGLFRVPLLDPFSDLVPPCVSWR